MYVMKTEGTIFIFEWMFVLNGSFKIQTPSPEFTQFEKSHEKLGISVPLFRRFTWHLLFSGLQSTRIALMIIQGWLTRARKATRKMSAQISQFQFTIIVLVIKKERLWAYLTMGMCLLNTYLGLVCIGVIVYYAFTQPEKAVRKRRCHNDEDDALMNFRKSEKKTFLEVVKKLSNFLIRLKLNRRLFKHFVSPYCRRVLFHVRN